MSNTAYGVLKNRATGLEIPGKRLYDYYDADSKRIEFIIEGSSERCTFRVEEFEFTEKPRPFDFPKRVGAIIKAKNFISILGETASDGYLIRGDSELGWILFSGDPDGFITYDESTLKAWDGTPNESGLAPVSYEVVFGGIDIPENSPWTT